MTLELCFGGIGFANLYKFLREEFPGEVDENTDKLFEWDEKVKLVMEYGLAGKDKLCARAVEMWMDAIGNEAGNLIAKSLPFGGFYIIGGMVSRNAEDIAKSVVFREALLS